MSDVMVKPISIAGICNKIVGSAVSDPPIMTPAIIILKDSNTTEKASLLLMRSTFLIKSFISPIEMDTFNFPSRISLSVLLTSFGNKRIV